MFFLYNKLLDVILKEILPITKIGVSKGNKIFGGAIINKEDLSTVILGTNNEIENPINHGEIVTLNNYYKFKKFEHHNVSNCIFLSTHEPCSLCLSAITWSGFNNFYYFFPYADTMDKFNIPHDLKIMKEIFNISDGNYNKINHYWKSFSIIKEVQKLKDSEQKILYEKISKIELEYSSLSNFYQTKKGNNSIPLN